MLAILEIIIENLIMKEFLIKFIFEEFIFEEFIFAVIFLQDVDILYEVLDLIDLSYSTVFWTKYESLYNMNYSVIFIYLVIAILLSNIIAFLGYLLNNQNPDLEKLSAYECGFEPYEDSRHKFNVQFCLISILFIIFDIEMMFMYPWCNTLAQLSILGFWSMIDFILELGIAFIYVWIMQALEWN